MATDWYCKIADREVGPFSSKQLKKMAATGDIRPDDPIRQGSTGPWIAAYRVKGLFAAPPPAAGGLPPDTHGSKSGEPTPLRAVPLAAAVPPAPPAPPAPPSPVAPAAPDVFAAIANEVYSSPRPTTKLHGKKVEKPAAAPPPTSEAQKKANLDKRVLIGIGVGIGVLALIGISLALWWRFGGAPKTDKATASKKEAPTDLLERAAEAQSSEPQAKTTEKESAKPAEKPADKSTEKAATDSAAAKPAADAADEKPPTKPKKSDPEVLGASRGTVMAGLNAVKSTRLILVTGATEGEISPRILLVQLGIQNQGAAEKTYQPWSAADAEKRGVLLMDDLGKTYPMKNYPEGAVQGQAAAGPIKSKGRVFDNLVFEPPDPAASILKLCLPGAAVGETGMFTFVIPKNRIKVVPDAPASANPLIGPTGPVKKLQEDPDKPPPDLGIQKMD